MNDKTKQLHRRYSQVLTQHLRWYKAWGTIHEEHARKWCNRLLNDNECPGAIAEACTRDILSRQVDWVEPHTPPGPDFLCHMNDEYKFYCESTSLEENAVTNRSGLESIPERNSGARYFSLLTESVFNKSLDKQKQCSNQDDVPTVLSIGTLHWQGAILGLETTCVESMMTGKTSMARNRINKTTGDVTNPLSEHTHLKGAVFLSPSENGSPKLARREIPLVLLNGYGAPNTRLNRFGLPWSVYGAIHPDPFLPMDHDVLFRIPMCRLCEGWQSGALSTEWLQARTWGYSSRPPASTRLNNQ